MVLLSCLLHVCQVGEQAGTVRTSVRGAFWLITASMAIVINKVFLCATHCSRHWDYTVNKVLGGHGACSLVEEGREQKISK